MKFLKKTSLFALVTLIGLLTSMVAPVFMSGAFAADKIVLDPDVKNTSVSSGYSASSVSDVGLGDIVRFRIKVNNVSGTELEKVTLRANLTKEAGSTKHWVMTSEAEIKEGNDNTSVRIPVSVLLKEDWNMEYVASSTKRSTNGEEPVAISDIASTSPLLRTNGYELTKYPAMSDDPQTLFYFDAKVIAGTPVTPQINIQFNKEFMNVTKGGTWAKTVTADPGDVVKARIWFHNGGVTNASDKPATEVVIKDSMSFSSASSFVNTATFSSKETGSLSSQATLNLSSAQSLSYVPGSTKVVVPTSTLNDINVLFNTGRRENIADVGNVSALMSSAGYQYGVLPFCWEHQRFVEFDVKVASTTVTTTPTPTPTPTTPGQVKAATLPNTGATETVMIGLLGSTMAGLYLRKFRILG